MSELTGACFQIDPSCQLGLLYFQSGKRRHSHYLGSGLRNLISTWNHIGVHTIHILPGTQVHLPMYLQICRPGGERRWLGCPNQRTEPPPTIMELLWWNSHQLWINPWLSFSPCDFARPTATLPSTHRCGPRVVQTPLTLTQWVANFNMPKKIHLNESLKIASKCVDKLYILIRMPTMMYVSFLKRVLYIWLFLSLFFSNESIRTATGCSPNVVNNSRYEFILIFYPNMTTIGATTGCTPDVVDSLANPQFNQRPPPYL